MYDFLAETRNYSNFLAFMPVYSGSLKRIDYPKQICLAHPFLLNVFTALKGTHLYIFNFGQEILVGVCRLSVKVYSNSVISEM